MNHSHTSPVLQAQGVSRSFGAIQVAKDINFELRPGARHALIGPNGAGKTTFVNLITGHLLPSHGTIYLGGQDVTHLSIPSRIQRGIARTFQINTLLQNLTVLENVQLAILERDGHGGSLLGSGPRRRAAEEAFDILETLRLDRHALTKVGLLAYGQQRMVEISIAMALKPKLMILDEPAAGVPPSDSDLVFGAIASLPESLAILLIEHDMKLVFGFAQTISVLVRGELIRQGTPAEIAADPLVKEVYLGKKNYD